MISIFCLNMFEYGQVHFLRVKGTSYHMDLAPRNNVPLMFPSNHVFDNCYWREVQCCQSFNKIVLRADDINFAISI